MSRSTSVLTGDETDLPVLEPRWPEPDVQPETPPRRPGVRRLGVAGLVLAAALAGAAVTHGLDRRTHVRTPAWMTSCQDAIDANAELHRFQDVQFAKGMGATFALVAGLHPRVDAVDTAAGARLQRDADSAIARCISPATPPA